MENERKIENIVREYFHMFSDEICIEEQKSEITRIDKLLKTPSKKGSWGEVIQNLRQMYLLIYFSYQYFKGYQLKYGLVHKQECT